MISKRVQLYLNVAKAVASLSKHDKCRVGAVLVKANDILSTACNVLKSHPVQMRHNVHRGIEVSQHHLHAEIATLLKVKDKSKLKGAVLYIHRVKRQGESGLARPCAACYNFIKTETPITECYYSTEGDYRYERIQHA